MRRKAHDITPIRDKAIRQFKRYPEWTPGRHIEFFLRAGRAVTERTVYRWLKSFHNQQQDEQ